MQQLINRSFRLWEYRVGLQRLLLRSPRKNENDHNVDIVFAGVKYLDLATDLGEILKIDTQETESQYVNIYTIESTMGSYTIKADWYSISTSDTYFTVSPFDD